MSLKSNLATYNVATPIFDTTFSASSIAGVPTADFETNTITLAGHGITNNMPLVFQVGTGVLPSGLNANDVYFTIGATTDTLQVSLTKAGAAVSLGTNGTEGWTFKKAGVLTLPITGLSLEQGYEYEVRYVQKNIPMNALNMYTRFTLEGATSIFGNSSVASTNELLFSSTTTTKKYSQIETILTITPRGNGIYTLLGFQGGIHADDVGLTTGRTLISATFIATITAPTGLTGVTVLDGYGQGYIANDTRVIVLRRKL
jgi:hypothetical protein